MKRVGQTELSSNDVWKNFACPKYVIRVCPKTDKIPKEIYELTVQSEVNADYMLHKLCELISDPVTNNHVLRISRLLYEYLCKIGDSGYRIKDLPLIIKILEFLAQNVNLVKEYKPHLDEMLKLCALPPLMEGSLESVNNYAIMEQYFTLLGQLLVILPSMELMLKVHKALHSLLLKTGPRNIAAAKPEYCCKTMENSRLPLTVVEVLKTSAPDTYGKILELVFLLSSVSCICSHRMLEGGVLNTIFIRMDLPYATQLRCTRPPDSLIFGNEYSEDMTFLIMNTLWSLIKSILPPKNVPTNLKKTSSSVHCALWGLRYAFERQTFYSQHQMNNLKIRNEIAVIILALLIAFPSWNFVSSGIPDVVIKYLIAVESGAVRIFSERVKFGETNEDLFFQKTLLLIVIHLAQIDACIFLMVKRRLIKTILQLVNPNIRNLRIAWSASQFWSLWTYAINALALLAPKMPNEFIKYNGIIRLLMILEWSLNTKFDSEIVLNCIKTVCTIILNDNVSLLENFREHGMALSLIKLITYILNLKKITMKEQRILTLALISIERLLKKQTFYQTMYGEQSIAFILKLLFRCLYQKDEEIETDQRLLLAIGSYIWECIVLCPVNLEKFIEYGAVYIILDIIEIIPYPSRCLFLGILTDMCDNSFCGPYLCTWRGVNKQTGLMSLLATIWREEEIRIKVKRCADGSVKDEELHEMGEKQLLETYHTNLCGNISPAIIDTIGSVRPKIYSIRKIIERDGERYEMAKERYKILYADLPVEDKITMCSIDLYFKLKLGQVWMEISKYFEQVGIVPLGMDGQAIFLMTQRYNSWGALIKEKQKRIIQAIKREEEIEEKDEYARICDSKLAIALDAFDELDYIYRTTNRAYMIKKKGEQNRQVDSALNFPPNSDNAHCHRTYQDNVMFTAIFGQHYIVSNNLMSNSNVNQMKILPVSPSNSQTSDEICSSEILTTVC